MRLGWAGVNDDGWSGKITLDEKRAWPQSANVVPHPPDPLDVLRGEKVEGLCTCSCHEDDSGGIRGTNHMTNVVDDAARYMAAKRVSSELDPEASAEAEEGDH